MLQAVASLQYPESPTVVGVLRSFMTLAGSDRSALEAYSRLGGQSSSRKVEFVCQEKDKLRNSRGIFSTFIGQVHLFLDPSHALVLLSPGWRSRFFWS